MSLLKPFGVILNILERLFGMSARNGAKPLVYACLTPQRELEGMGPCPARPCPALPCLTSQKELENVLM